jgi:hypothetical protein
MTYFIAMKRMLLFSLLLLIVLGCGASPDPAKLSAHFKCYGDKKSLIALEKFVKDGMDREEIIRLFGVGYDSSRISDGIIEYLSADRNRDESFWVCRFKFDSTGLLQSHGLTVADE